MKVHDDIAAAFLMLALITRPRAEADILAALLSRLGIAALVEPLIEIAQPATVLPPVAGKQAILCTSANGGRALAEATGERNTRVFAVGDATTRAAGAA